MSNDFIPKRPSEAPPTESDDLLLKTFEELIASPSSFAGCSSSNSSNACPEMGEWIQVASGEAHPSRVDGLLAHAALCPVCAPRLRQSLRLIMEETTPEEDAEAARLASSSAAWRHQLAVELAHTTHLAARKPMPGFYLWAGAALAATLVLALGFGLWWQRAHAPEQLLAAAYTDSRSFDLRMPDAGFAEVLPRTHLRGSADQRESSKLLDARSRIERRLESAGGDPHWLQLEARADVMEEKFDPAIDIFDRLLASGPVTSSLLTDDATAYFQRGNSTDSENDRATAFDYLRRADELTPGDPVVLFNEAIVMEDRGQVMNAVETWNRYLRFEHDPRWLAEGRRRLQALEIKLDKLKTHQSRMQEHLATPQAMRSLAANSATLAALDEELSSTLLPALLDSAFPLPVDRSRGSPRSEISPENALAARTLLRALAVSLERNHQDTWLTHLLPSDSAPPKQDFLQAVHLLGQAIDADVRSDFISAQRSSRQASQLFHAEGNLAGEDRALLELSYAQMRVSSFSDCYQVAHRLVGRDPQFAWIQIQGSMQNALCGPAVGSTSEDNPRYKQAIIQAQAHAYTLSELRGRDLIGAAAIDSGDTETSWKIYLPTVRKFYAGDYPALRLYMILAGLADVEEITPRTRLAYLQRMETVQAAELTTASVTIPTERFRLAADAIRAGYTSEAQLQMRTAQDELAANDDRASVKGLLSESEMTMANLYLARHDLAAAARMLDAARDHIAGDDNAFHSMTYALTRGRLELALGHPAADEPMLRDAIRGSEYAGHMGGVENISLALQDRKHYAVLAGIWLAQGRSGEDILALWERFRLRSLGLRVPVCADKGLTCLKPELLRALSKLGGDRLYGQVVLLDRTLLYQASAKGVVWTMLPISEDDLLAITAPLERVVSSPATSQDSVDQAARRIGDVLLPGLADTSADSSQLLIESDPLLGNLPWSAVETAAGPIGLHFNLEETPSLLFASHAGSPHTDATGASLVVGASIASEESTPLPEVLEEARAVARFGERTQLLLGAQATRAQIVARLGSSSSIHFAGHAIQQSGETRLLLAPGRESSADPAQDHSYLNSDLLRKYPPRAARLVVFSACSTGKKDAGWNHGNGEIVNTLAALGVRDVVATRWQIDSSSAVLLMNTFYSELARGVTVPRALTLARQSLIHAPRYHHPYYWAAYYASGTGNSDLSQLFRDTRQ